MQQFRADSVRLLANGKAYNKCAWCKHPYKSQSIYKMCSSACRNAYKAKDEAGREKRLNKFLSKLTPEQRAKYER